MFVVVARRQFAEDVLHHDHGAVHDDAEIDGADGEQVGGNVPPVQADERKQQRERNGDRHNQRGPHAEQKNAQDHQHQQHAAQQVALHGLGGFLDQALAVVVRNHLHVRRQDVLVQLLGHALDAPQNHLRLLADAHQNDALHGFILLHVPELAEARRVADLHLRDVLHVDRDAALLLQDDVADVRGIAHQAQPADVVELPALRIEAAARVGIVVRRVAGATCGTVTP